MNKEASQVVLPEKDDGATEYKRQVINRSKASVKETLSSNYEYERLGSIKIIIDSMTRMSHFVVFLTTLSFLVSTANSTSNTISYVMEPFDAISPKWFSRTYDGQGKVNLTITDSPEDSLSGKGAALRVDYEVFQTQNWGGFVDFGWILNERAHSCAGGDRLSLWYKVVRPQSNAGRVHLRVLLMDDSDCADGNEACSEPPGQNLENYYSFHYVLDDDNNDEWKEITVELKGAGNDGSDPPPFWRTGWTGQTGNDVLDPARIRGWRIELSMDSQAGLGSSSAGEILLDQLSCQGGGKLLGAPFYYQEIVKDNVFGDHDVFASAVADGTWHTRFYGSDAARNESETTLVRREVNDSSLVALRVNYTIEQTENWGGFNDYNHLAPGAAYYNLSGAEAVSFQYEVESPLDEPSRAQVRLILMDDSDCVDNGDDGVVCDEYPGQNLENYYSFHPVLDGDPEAPPTTVSVKLNGSDSSESPFWRTGWTGQVGNNRFDKERLKGYRLELNIDSQGDVGSKVRGVVLFDDLKVSFPLVNGTSDEDDKNNSVVCVEEPELVFDTEFTINDDGEKLKLFRRIDFITAKCKKTCLEDTNCLYAFSTALHCHMSPAIYPDVIGLRNTTFKIDTQSACWKDDVRIRGDFCDRCDCDARTFSIDCRGKNLTIVPKTFTPNIDASFDRRRHRRSLETTTASWTPVTLDLRDNPRLVMLGTGMLDAIASDLRDIKLPEETRFVSPRVVEALPSLENLTFASEVRAVNIIADNSSFYDDVCCTRGDVVSRISPPVRFCEMEVDLPGADSVKEPFIEYNGADPLDELLPSSDFMSEAAESVDKCAEYCSIRVGCNYYTYDARWKESEHRCFLLKDQGTPQKICCNADDFGDTKSTLPGFTSGRPPRTRNKFDNAKVIVEPLSGLRLDESNDFTVKYTVSLGSTPLRGSVWIEPKVGSNVADYVNVDPSRIVLYDNTTEVEITVTANAVNVLENVPAGGKESLVLTNNLISCDVAFTASSTLASETTVYADIIVDSEEGFDVVAIAVAVPIAVAVLFALVWLYVDKKRRKADAVWNIRLEDLKFDDPPEIIGRGTFGLVLQAEYRGTQVAVKRVIPPRVVDRPRRNSLATDVGVNNDSLFGSGDRLGLSSLTTRGSISSSFGSSGSGHRRSLGGSLGILRRRSNESNANFDQTKMDIDPEAAVIFETDEAKDKGTQSGILENDMVNGSGSGSGNRFAKKSTFATLGLVDEYTKLKADFVKEMRHLSKLRHPCITTVMGAVVGKNQEPMLVMEYMDHGSLYDVIHNETMHIGGEQILPILRDIAHGIRFLHAADPQVIHGDLKAANILVDSRFRAKVADFGLSQKKRVGATGTPYWMAPELLRQESSNTAESDVYSFGIILCEVYSRSDPYKGEDFKEVLKKVADPKINKRPPIPAAAPPNIQAIIAQCLNGDPIRRPSFEELDVRLKQLEISNVEPSAAYSGKSYQSKKDRQNLLTESLLFDVFPKHIATALRDGVKPEPEHRDIVTIFFSDIVGFTNISSTLPAIKISDMLDRLYSKFDALSDAHDVFKVETIGDAYMAVTNLVKDQAQDHARRIANFSIDALKAANETVIDLDDPDKGYVNIRVGFHSGSVVANVVGSRNPRYCLFGDTVNTASRMESNSKENRIHCSERSAKVLQIQDPSIGIVCRGNIEVKGKGSMKTYWINEGSNVVKRANGILP